MQPRLKIGLALIVLLLPYAVNAGPVRGGTAGGLAFGAQQPPEAPPGVVGAPPSVDEDRYNSLLKIPPWSGFPCQAPGGSNFCDEKDDNVPGADLTNGDEGCPVKEDIKGDFGQIYSITTRSNTTLQCGGTVPLSVMEFSTVPNPDRLIIADGSGNLVIYKRATNIVAGAPDFKIDDTIALPAKLCQKKADGSLEETIDFPRPSAQMALFRSNATQVVLRTTSGSTNGDNVAERVLVLPIKNGTIDALENCPIEASIYKIRPQSSGEVSFTMATAATACMDEKISIKTGPCAGSTLYMNLDKPVLAHQPERTASFLTIEGRSDMLTVTTDASTILMQGGSAIRLGSAQGDYILSEGGRIILKNGNILEMKAPAHIDPASGRIFLKNGGYTKAPSGDVRTEMAAGTITPNADRPYIIYPEKRLLVPAGMLIPTAEDPTLRLPLKTPQ